MKKTHVNELKALGTRIQQQRRERKMTQEDIAFRMGCSLTYISKLENGRASCNLERLLELSNILQCDVAELLCGINVDSPKYLEVEFSRMMEQLSSEDKELLYAMMEVMVRRKQKDEVEYALP